MACSHAANGIRWPREGEAIMGQSRQPTSLHEAQALSIMHKSPLVLTVIPSVDIFGIKLAQLALDKPQMLF